MSKNEIIESLGWTERDISKEGLSEKGIFELRFVARKLGVSSPTTLSKNGLVDAIHGILVGEVVPDNKNNKRGRPPVPSFFEKKSYNQDAEIDVQAVYEQPPRYQSPQPPQGYVNNNQSFNQQSQGYDRPRYNQNQNHQQGGYNQNQSHTQGGYNQNQNHAQGGYNQNQPHVLYDGGAGGQPQYRNNGYVNNHQSGYYQNTQPRKSFLRGDEPIDGDLEIREGILDIHADGYGFIRVKNCEYDDKDAYIHAAKIKKLGLRAGDIVKGQCRTTTDGKPSMVIVISVNGKPADELGKRPYFDELRPIFPDKKFTLECEDSKSDFAIRSIDLVAPIGKGQRALIVSPPKAGKTTLLKNIAKGISGNYPDALLLVLLIDERPEEVTDIQNSVKGEVVYSTFDETPEHHTMAAEILLNRAKRQVELGRDVVILMDSLTRLARAYNNTIPPSGKTLSGGIDPAALLNPKKFFGAARNVDGGGSLTIIATALIDTGSRMDDVIYEEFKGTGNMEIILDRSLSEKRIFPAIDLNKSGTRREDLLLSPEELEAMWSMRKLLSSGGTVEATEKLMSIMMKTKDNKEFVSQVNKLMKNNI